MRVKVSFLKNRKILLLLFAELAMLLIGVSGLFGKSGVILEGQDTEWLVDEGIPLSAGVYTLKLYYEGEGDSLGDFGVEAENPMYKTLLCNNVPLYAGAGESACQFYLLDSVENLRAVLNVAENVEVQGLELIAEKGGSRIWLFWVITGSLLLDGYLLAAWRQRIKPFSAESRLVIFGIPGITLVSSLPLLVDYTIMGEELMFHMMRIEALADSIKWGQLGVRIEAAWLAGHGYASSIFCGDTWLVLPALLRIIGFPMDSAYRIFVAAVNLATALIAYASFSRCFRSRYIGIFGSVLYTLAPYRLYNIYNRAAVGEYTAMIFLPLLAWGFYRIFTEDPKGKGYFWNWVIPAIGFTGIMQSHMPSCELAVGFAVLLCLVLWRKTFRRRTFIVLLNTAGITVAVNAWYLVPFLDLMAADKYNFNGNGYALIQSRGLLPAQIFYTLQADAVGLGAALLLCLVLWLVIRRRNSGSLSEEYWKREKRAGDIAFGMTALALFMSTCLFPWDLLSKSSRFAAAMADHLQFPGRMIFIAAIASVFTACVMGVWFLREKAGVLSGKTVLAFIGLISFVFGSYQVNDILLTRNEVVKLYSAQSMGSTAVLDGAYLPIGAEVEHMTYHESVISEGGSMEGYEKEGLSCIVYVTAEKESYIEFPMLYYKGYRAKALETGEMLTAVKGENSDVRVLLPEGFQGTVRVWYDGMWYWRLAEALSVIVSIGLLMYSLRMKMKRMKQGAQR